MNRTRTAGNSRPSVRFARIAKDSLQASERDRGRLDIPACYPNIEVTVKRIVREKLRGDFARFARQERNVVVAPHDGKEFRAVVLILARVVNSEAHLKRELA